MRMQRQRKYGIEKIPSYFPRSSVDGQRKRIDFPIAPLWPYWSSTNRSERKKRKRIVSHRITNSTARNAYPVFSHTVRRFVFAPNANVALVKPRFIQFFIFFADIQFDGILWLALLLLLLASLHFTIILILLFGVKISR